MLCVRVPLKKAQEVKRFIRDNGLGDPNYASDKTKTLIFFPIKKKGSLKKQFQFIQFADRPLKNNTFLDKRCIWLLLRRLYLSCPSNPSPARLKMLM